MIGLHSLKKDSNHTRACEREIFEREKVQMLYRTTKTPVIGAKSKRMPKKGRRMPIFVMM
jgi:hypothetical protein